MSRPRSSKPRSSVANIRFTEEEYEQIKRLSEEGGFSNVSEYIRSLHSAFMAQQIQAATDSPPKYNFPKKDIRSYHKTKHGEIFWGDSRSWLFSVAEPNSVDLIMTSPPFGLVRKKQYGNEDADVYCDWFRSFAEGFKRVLKDDGSLVIDIGGAWVPGLPTRSLYHFKLLVMLVEEFGFHLCQEHYWWNPSKLPSPAEWVNVRRIRVKDSVNCVWWLSKTPYPKANNKRVLQPYSGSMQALLKNGYKARKRPSGHDISDNFNRDNGGAVPHNLLAIANTESNGLYQDYCRENNIKIHPARFPSQLPEYFIRYLTNPGDLVMDPFGGSCVTGSVAEKLKRKWVCSELSEEYLQGAMARFKVDIHPAERKSTTYEIAAPCALPIDEKSTPLIMDGGKDRPAALRKLKNVG